MPYLGKSPSAGVRQRYQYTATAGQTTFSGTDLGNLTLTYTDNNFVDVFQNGVLLKGGGTDYTATSGTSVVLATGASVSDVIEIIVYDVFSVGNFFNRTDSDSRYLNVAGDTMTGSLDLNGTELVLDADGDTTIHADTDDQIDIKVAGADKVRVDSSGRVGINTGTSTLTSQLNVGTVGAASIGGDGAMIGGTKESFSSSVYKLWKGQLTVFDDSTQAEGTGGAIILGGSYLDADQNPIHCATFEASKANGTDNNYEFNAVIRHRENGNATMQISALFGQQVQFFTNNTHRFNIDSSGNLTASDTSIGSLSDERLKENIDNYTYPLDTFKKFEVKTFDWKQPQEHLNKTKQKGLVAQDVEKVDANFVYEYEIVDGSKDGQYVPSVEVTEKVTDDMDGVERTFKHNKKFAKASKLGETDAMYISVIQQLIAKVDALEARIKKLEDG